MYVHACVSIYLPAFISCVSADVLYVRILVPQYVFVCGCVCVGVCVHLCAHVCVSVQHYVCH